MDESRLIMYTAEDGLTKIEATFDQDTVWLSLDQMAELFQRDKSTISRHIKNVFSEGELNKNSVVANFATTQTEGMSFPCGTTFLTYFGSTGSAGGRGQRTQDG